MNFNSLQTRLIHVILQVVRDKLEQLMPFSVQPYTEDTSPNTHLLKRHDTGTRIGSDLLASTKKIPGYDPQDKYIHEQKVIHAYAVALSPCHSGWVIATIDPAEDVCSSLEACL